jgi:hypothetical protein
MPARLLATPDFVEELEVRLLRRIPQGLAVVDVADFGQLNARFGYAFGTRLKDALEHTMVARAFDSCRIVSDPWLSWAIATDTSHLVNAEDVVSCLRASLASFTFERRRLDIRLHAVTLSSLPEERGEDFLIRGYGALFAQKERLRRAA